jgi:pentatricopeptide repeat protein
MTKVGVPADVIAYSTIIHACAKAGEPVRAEEVLKRMEAGGVEPNTICFNEVINAFAENGNLLKAEQYFEAIQQRNLPPSTSTYNSILKACVKSGDVAQAEAWFQKMVSSGLEGVELDATTFGTLMNAWKDTDPMKTDQWLQAARSHGVKLNVVHYSTAIHAHAKVGALDKAEGLLEQALADGIEPNTMCYNNVISACAAASQPGRAEEVLGKMRQSGVAPNSFTCFSVANAWLKVGDFARAKNIITTMESEGLQPREEVFTAYAKTVAWSGTPFHLEDCVKMASERGCQDTDFFLHAHLSALSRFRSQPTEVEAVVRTAFRRGVKLNSYIRGVLIRALGNQRADALIEECGGISESSSRSGNRKAHNYRYRA